VFINVFGGILRCDRLAAGLIAAVTKLGVRMPIVVRMEGTNVELGRKMLADSGLNFTSANDMGDGAQKVVALARGQTLPSGQSALSWSVKSPECPEGEV
jgi:succinyl-CoA synthetase beta subunit